MPLALNLLALVIVLGLCWAAIMWLGNKSHGQRFSRDQHERYPEPGYISIVEPSVSVSAHDEPCELCEGVGAQQSRDGKLAPCPECLGTGVLTA